MLAFIVWREHPFLARALAFENSPVTWLQTCVMSAGIALCAVLRWWGFGALLLVATVDERFMFHEAVAYHTANAWLVALPMLAYGVAGALLLVWWWRRSPPARPWMLAAAGCAAAAIVLDLVSRAVEPQIREELLELGAMTATLGGLLTSVRSSRS